MQTELNKFMDNVEILNKDFSKYEDKKGNYLILNTVNLMTRVEVLELSKEEYNRKVFEQAVDKLEYKIENTKRPVSKYTITKKEEDKYTIVDSEVSVRVVYNVVNNASIHKSFINKEDALKFSKEINSKILSYFN